MTEARLTTDAVRPDPPAAGEVPAVDLGAVFEEHAPPMYRTILAYTGVEETSPRKPSAMTFDAEHVDRFHAHTPSRERSVIVRDGTTVGLVSLTPITHGTDPRGGGLGRVHGEVCGDSSIEGNVPPRDPDEDGVELDCLATRQVAFRTPGNPVLFGEAEPLMRGVVDGIRETDFLLPPRRGAGLSGYDGVWTVEREGKIVASIDYPTLDGITCRWNAIGVDPNER